MFSAIVHPVAPRGILTVVVAVELAAGNTIWPLYAFVVVPVGVVSVQLLIVN